MKSIFSKNQYEIVKDNLNAFLHNFNNVRIEKADSGGGFYVFVGNSDSWIQYCYNIHYLNGWLYGCVQAVNRKDLLNELKKDKDFMKDCEAQK